MTPEGGGGPSGPEGGGDVPTSQEAITDPRILENYCPVSSLPFMEKVEEKVVRYQVQSALDETDYLNSGVSYQGTMWRQH